MTLSHSLALSLFHSPYFLLFKTLQQKFLIAYSLPFSFLPSLSLFPLLAHSFTLSVFLSVSGSILHVSFQPASGLISSAAMQLDRDSFPVPFYSLLTSYCMSLFQPASGLISSAAIQLDRDSFPVLFYFLLTSLFILTLS